MAPVIGASPLLSYWPLLSVPLWSPSDSCSLRSSVSSVASQTCPSRQTRQQRRLTNSRHFTTPPPPPVVL
uniref:Putative secreted protein n=1 Tax=Anopheles marajoara TaxID=58244 RepID=A0A2M4CEW7_9DIPT